MRCPNCSNELRKKEDGEGVGVKFCSKCKASWYILQLRPGEQVQRTPQLSVSDPIKLWI